MCIKVKQTDYDCVTSMKPKECPDPMETHKTPKRAGPSQRASADTENSSLTSYYSPQVHTSPHQLDVHAGERFTMFRLMSPSCVRLAPLSSLPQHTLEKRKETAAGGLVSLAMVATAFGLPYEPWMQVFGSAVNKKKSLLLLQWKSTLDLCMPRPEKPKNDLRVPEWHSLKGKWSLNFEGGEKQCDHEDKMTLLYVHAREVTFVRRVSETRALGGAQ